MEEVLRARGHREESYPVYVSWKAEHTVYMKGASWANGEQVRRLGVQRGKLNQ